MMEDDLFFPDFIGEKYREIYTAAQAAIGSCEPLDYGPGHVVFDDYNFDDDSIISSILRCDGDERSHYVERYGESAVAIVRDALVKLLAVPYSERAPGRGPDGYPLD